MARIPLRVYNREIEGLIERGQIEEAIAHCKNILKQLPKHIDTYRLLGKAFLESQRYTEAVDILQRVLSVYPDDFVSQLGMSIIREDEGNLDAAIWHMERAYEVQPFNRAVQDELRRLYGRRDGAEPPKIRLNRGSLVRMYARGELYPQAIAEARAALAEDPQRADLLVLLARMYYLSGQKVEAAEIASTLISKLPHCYEANRILQEILPSTSRADEAKGYQQRVFALAPYMAFLTPNAPTPEQVPDQAVMVEKVDWQPNYQEQQGPDWARTIGVQWEQKEEESLPDWLSNLKPEGSVADQNAQATQPASTDDPNIPDFLKSAGWGESTGAAQEGPVDFSEEEVGSAAAAEAIPSEIPDWLQAMAPTQFESPKEEKEQLDWLDSILPGAAAATAIGAVAESAASEAPAEKPEPTQADQGLDWLTPPASSAEAGAESLDWLSTESAPASDDNLDWLTTQPAAETNAVDAVEMPDWLNQEAKAAPVVSEEAPDWLKDSAPAASEETTVEPSTDTSASTDLPGWLEEAAPIQTPEETIAGLQEPLAEAVAVPDWLKEMAPTEPETVSEVAPESAEEPLAEAVAVPDWLKEMAPTEPETVSEVAPESAEEPLAETVAVPDWLKEMAPTEAEVVDETRSEAAEEPVSEQVAETPEWLQETPAAEEAVAEVLSEPSNGAATTAEMGEMPEDLDAALAWMEALAARQGAEADSLKITAPEDRTTETPDWIKAQGVEMVEETEAPAETPQWLQETAPEQSQPEAIESAEEAVAEPVDVPDWLKDMAPTEAATVIEPTPEMEEEIAEEPVAEQAEAIPEWLQESQPVVEAVVEDLPETPAVTAEPPAAEMGEMPEDLDAALAWMEALAARQGADEASLKITAPEDRTTETPDWIKAQGEESVEEAPVASETPQWLQETVEEEPDLVEEPIAEAADVPDWLKEIAPVVSETVSETVPETVEEPEIGQTEVLPEWLQEESPTAVESVAQETSELPIVAAETPAAGMGEMPEDLDAALAWMEALAARQGAEADSLKITTPEERSLETPDWIKDLPSEPEAVVEETVEVVAETNEAITESLEIPAEAVAEAGLAEILEEPAPTLEDTQPTHLKVPAEPAQEETAASAADEDFAWLESLAARQGADETTLVTPPAEREETPPQWVTGSLNAAALEAAEAQRAETAPETPEADIPDWLRTYDASTQAQEITQSPVEAEAEPVVSASVDDLPEWLKADAQTQDTQVSNWLESLEEPTAEVTTQAEVEPVEQPSEWVQEPEFTPAPPPAYAPAEPGSVLAQAEEALAGGNLASAIEQYNQLINEGANLPETIRDLHDALYRYPVDVSLWQTLGDAYIRNDQVQEALDAYTKAEELLR